MNGELFARIFRSGAAAVNNNKQKLNELNVFPIPDGDTGVNMSMTITAGAAKIGAGAPKSVGETADLIAGALLRGARGNSGVILSLLYRGFAKGLKGIDEAKATDIAVALKQGVDSAYKAVMKPAEGTILSVSKAAALRAIDSAKTNADIEVVLADALESAEIALKETVELNPVLKKAGVVDAGGQGYVFMFAGMLSALRGTEIAQNSESNQNPTENVFEKFTEEDINFTYCTEFIVEKSDPNADALRFRAFLESIGDCVVVVDDDGIIKIHTHTNEPDKALGYGLKLGSLQSIKIENMRQQHTQKLNLSDYIEEKPSVPPVAAPEKTYGFVAVGDGNGITELFANLGADQIVRGGQTMNPSTDEILAAVNATPAEIVFVFPNNKNIIMAAEQTERLSEKKVVVIPTRTIPQGVSAMLAFDESMDIGGNAEAMREAASLVHTGQITYAARDSEFDGNHIKQNDYIAMLEGKMTATGPDLDKVASDLADRLCANGGDVVSVFYGADVSAEDAEKIGKLFADRLPDADLSVVSGGQSVYYYIISVE